MPPNRCDLSSCFLCRLSLPEWTPAIEKNRVELKFRKGQVIFEEGSEVKGMYFVTSGLVKVHKHWGPSKELIIRFAKGGDIFGHRGFGNERIFPITATGVGKFNIKRDRDWFETVDKIEYLNVIAGYYRLQSFLVRFLNNNSSKPHVVFNN